MFPVLQLPELAQLPSDSPRYAVIGHPVAHSLSPQMQLAAFQACKLPASYVRVEVPPDQLEHAVKTFRDLRFHGWNCTLPHKVALAPLMDQLADSAQALRAVNTVLLDDGQLIGFNTDGDGWVRAIRDDFFVDVRDLRILILGLGGAGQALARQAALEKCERLVLVNRSPDKAAALRSELEPLFHTTKLLGAQDRFKVIPWDETLISQELNTIDLVVNTTSVGLRPADPPVLPARILQPHLLIYDTIYRPAKTRFLQAATEAGCRSANGLSMLLHQGALSFETWTGRSAPLAAMRAALREAAA